MCSNNRLSQVRFDAAVHCIVHACNRVSDPLLNNLQAQDKLVSLGYKFGPVHYLDWSRRPNGHRQWVARSDKTHIVVTYNEYGNSWWLDYQEEDDD